MFRKFPSIEQFKNCIKQVHDYSKYNNIPTPTLKFTGTVKLHGTNSAVGLDISTGEKFFQSRERLITPEDDNYGFATWASQSTDVHNLLYDILNHYDAKQYIHVYGEWAGKGIQKTVAIASLEKSFYIFDIVVDGVSVDLPDIEIDKFNNIYFLNQFPMFEIDIDFSNPHNSQNKLVELTLEVEAECPVSKVLNVIGTGEGIVWYNKQYDLRFKTKGVKHSNSKVTAIKEVAAADIEKINNVKEFVDKTLTENRLNQGIEKLKEMGLDPNDNKNTNAFIKWCADDVFREERDIIEESNLDTKLLGKELSAVARNFFVNYFC